MMMQSRELEQRVGTLPPNANGYDLAPDKTVPALTFIFVCYAMDEIQLTERSMVQK